MPLPSTATFQLPEVQMYPRPMRRPHTPILLGGYSDGVLKRVGQHCQGWLPAYAGTRLLTPSETDMTGPEHLKQGRAKIMAHAHDAGRDIARSEIGAILAPDADSRDLRNIFEAAGVDRLAFSLPHIESIEDARIALEKIVDWKICNGYMKGYLEAPSPSQSATQSPTGRCAGRSC